MEQALQGSLEVLIAAAHVIVIDLGRGSRAERSGRSLRGLAFNFFHREHFPLCPGREELLRQPPDVLGPLVTYQHDLAAHLQVEEHV